MAEHAEALRRQLEDERARGDGLALARELAARAGAEPAACDLLRLSAGDGARARWRHALAGSGIAFGGQDCHAARDRAPTPAI